MQQQTAPLEQALGQKLFEEININIQLRAQLIEAQEKIKQLEEKKEPKMSIVKDTEAR